MSLPNSIEEVGMFERVSWKTLFAILGVLVILRVIFGMLGA